MRNLKLTKCLAQGQNPADCNILMKPANDRFINHELEWGFKCYILISKICQIMNKLRPSICSRRDGLNSTCNTLCVHFFFPNEIKGSFSKSVCWIFARMLN